MIKEAIILAGGMGTRLKQIISDVPKPMADIKGKPFLAYLLAFLKKQGIERIVFSVGYKYEIIQKYFLEYPPSLDIVYSIEEKPLGTGGAIQKALTYINGTQSFVINGDTFFAISLAFLEQKHQEHGSALSIALKEMERFDRYGTVTIGNDSQIVGFEEKQWKEKGWINAGICILHREIFSSFPKKELFSFEKDFLPFVLAEIQAKGFLCEGYFIDIGIPEDYYRAQEEIPELLKDITIYDRKGRGRLSAPLGP